MFTKFQNVYTYPYVVRPLRRFVETFGVRWTTTLILTSRKVQWRNRKTRFLTRTTLDGENRLFRVYILIDSHINRIEKNKCNNNKNKKLTATMSAYTIFTYLLYNRMWNYYYYSRWKFKKSFWLLIWFVTKKKNRLCFFRLLLKEKAQWQN